MYLTGGSIFEYELFIQVSAILAMGMLVLNCFEVGQNDAANLVNAVFGSRVLEKKEGRNSSWNIVVLGATFASPVRMDTVRKGIFNLETIDSIQAITLYLSAYIVGTVLLNSYSAFGMPVSTTATLVFCLAGGAMGVTGDFNAVNWPTFLKVVAAIIISIFLTGIGGFFIQPGHLQGAVGDKSDDHKTVLLQCPWIAGLILTFLTWFMVIKGLKGISAVKVIKKELFDHYGTPPVLLVYWAVLSFVTYVVLKSLPKKFAKYLFHVLPL